MMEYTSPEIEILKIQVEQGYAESGTGGDDDGMSTPTVGGF